MIQETQTLLRSIRGSIHTIGELPLRVTSLATDSRRVRPGALYVALIGDHVDGHDFVSDAVTNGAVAVLAMRSLAIDAPQIIVESTRSALSQVADTFYDSPSRALCVVGVTGTNGKTTTVHLIAAILEAAGMPCATVGTLGVSFAGSHEPLANTTPLADELHALLAGVRAQGARAVAMEVSSHALDLQRVDDVHFAAATFTNLTRDHLDFHRTMQNYRRAKRHLFELAPTGAINVDDPTGAELVHELRHTLGFGFTPAAAICGEGLEVGADGSRFRVEDTDVSVRLPGRYNASNALAAFATARVLGIPDAASVAGLVAVERVPGRMERIAAQGVTAIVDYAHTPDALANVLAAAREMTSGALVVVFGCGGDRDRGKRPQMGAVAAGLADRAIVTSDNPRSEDPREIAREIAAGLDIEIELDRATAIARAIRDAAPGDTIVVAGKGHETYQIIGDRTFAFDDAAVVRAALAKRAPQEASR